MKRLLNAVSVSILALPLLAATCESFDAIDPDLSNVAEGRMIGVDYPVLFSQINAVQQRSAEARSPCGGS